MICACQTTGIEKSKNQAKCNLARFLAWGYLKYLPVFFLPFRARYYMMRFTNRFTVKCNYSELINLTLQGVFVDKLRAYSFITDLRVPLD